MSKKLVDPRLVRARGPEIAALQRAAGLSDTALAGKASTSASTIRNAKRSRFLRLDSLNGIALAFGVALDEIADLNEMPPYRNRGAGSEARRSEAESSKQPHTHEPEHVPNQLPVVATTEPSLHRGAGRRHRPAMGATLVTILALLLLGAPLAIFVADPVAKSGPFAAASVRPSDLDDCAHLGIGCTPASIQHQDDRASDQTGSIEKPTQIQREETANLPAPVGPEAEAGAHSEQEPFVVASADACVRIETVQVEIKIDETSAQLPALVPCEWKTKIPFSERWIKTNGMCAHAKRTVTAKVPQVTVRQPSRCTI